ncbi:MAG: hypothetical protein O7B99_10890, partial [Planctomycetota bacterium]|nr:hypothetical protein [Planctomycetota bacterium]
MKMIRTVCTGLASVLLVSTYAAGQDPACCDGPPGPCCALAEGDSCDEAGPYRLSLPIEGFSEEAQEAFSTALLGIERPIYECAGHPQTLSEKAGTCADCGGAKLVERRIPAIASIGIQIL